MSSFLKSIKNHTGLWCDFFLDLIFPIECINCGEEKIWLCEKCFKTINLNSESLCPACDRKTFSSQYCIYCQENFSLNGIFVASNYENKIVKASIKNLKYHLIKDLSLPLAKLLSQYFLGLSEKIKKLPSDNPDAIINYELAKNLFSDLENILIIPIPLHPRRLRWRGFNQAELIAEHFAQNLNFKIDKKNLIRKKFRTPQAKLNKKDRIDNIKNCFSWQGGNINQKILLIDDIATTGSTLNECAKILKQNGAEQVWGLVVAKN